MGKTLTGTELIQILSRVKEECTTPIDDTLTQQGAAADAKKTGDEISDLKSAISEYRLLFVSEIEDTIQTLTRDSSGNVNGMIHSRNGSTIRTDTYVKANGIFTETRTLASGKYITLITDLSTKVTTISDVQEAA